MRFSNSSSTLSKRLAALFVVVVLASLWTRLGWAQEVQIDLSTLIPQIQKYDARSDSLNMAMWYPEQFWRAVISEDTSMPQSDIEEALDVFRPYVVVAVLAGELGPFGAPHFKPKADVLANTRLIDEEGTVYEPLTSSALDLDMQSFLAVFEPMMTQSFGPMGDAMVLVVFPARRSDRAVIADATREGRFQVTVGDSEFQWRLPLGAVLPPKTCPADGEEMSGAWRYCPWHGVELMGSNN